MWEATDLGTVDGAAVSAASAISDNGTIVGTLSGFELHAGSRGFAYANGVMQELQHSGSNSADAINAAGQIAGIDDVNEALIVWNSSDAAPRRLGAGATDVLGMNARGDILTNFDNGEGHGVALLWQNDVPQDLGYLADQGVGRPSTSATAWNERGQIVGRSKSAVYVAEYSPPSEIFHPFIWENGVMRDLGVLVPHPCQLGEQTIECGEGEATGINAQGVVVGSAAAAGSLRRAFVWENGEMRDLGVCPGHYTSALAINDRGQILAIADTVANPAPACPAFFLWDNGQVRAIGAAGASPRPFDVPPRLGPHGEVIGSMAVGDTVLHAFIWQDGQLTDLGPGKPAAMNARGDIVGSRGFHAMLWGKKSGQ